MNKKSLFIIFAQRANSSGVLLELFRRGSEKCFIDVLKNILGRKVCGKIISSSTVFRLCAKTVGPSEKFLRQGLVWNSFYVSLAAFSEVFSRVTKSLFIKLLYWANFFCRNFSGRIEKSGFQVSAGNVWWQGYFLKKFNIFGRGAKTSRFCVAYLPLELTKLHYTCSIKTFQREVFRKIVNSFMKLEYWLNSSSVSGHCFSAGLSKLRPTCL